MPAKKKYTGSLDDFEKKLERVMKRLGVDENNYSFDYSSSRTQTSCFVEMRYGASTYRFENSTKKSQECGRGLVYVSDLFTEIVYSLEGLARAVEKGIFTLDMLLSGVPKLTEGIALEPCFKTMGFSHRPVNEAEVKAQYRVLMKEVHPDLGGSEEAFIALKEAYEEAMKLMGGAT